MREKKMAVTAVTVVTRAEIVRYYAYFLCNHSEKCAVTE